MPDETKKPPAWMKDPEFDLEQIHVRMQSLKEANERQAGRIRTLEHERTLLGSKVQTMLRALQRVPALLSRSDIHAVPRSHDVDAFLMQLRQFEMPALSIEQAEAIDKRLAEMGAYALAREEIGHEYAARLEAEQDRRFEEHAKAEKQREVLLKNFETIQEELRDSLNKSEAKSARRRQRELEACHLVDRYHVVFKKLVDVCRGFEGTLAEQVRRLCVRELDAWAVLVKEKAAAREAARNPGFG